MKTAAETCWDLEALYPSVAAWQADFDRLPRLAEAFAAFKGRLAESPAVLKAAIEASDAFDRLAEVLADAAAPGGFLSDPQKTPPGDTTGFFAAEKFREIWPSILANTPPEHEARLRAFHRWFDGLKTLRFLHAVQRAGR